MREEDATRNAGGDPPVTVVVSRRVRPGREAEFEEFISGITAVASRFTGHMGATIFRPSDPNDHEYRVVFKFDHESNLARWEASEERKAWYARAKGLAEDEPATRKVTGLETWFTLPGQSTITPPPRYKMAIVTWLAVYPLITSIFFLLQPIFSQMSLPLRTLVLTGIMIPAMTYVIMPGMARLFRRWLYPADSSGADEHAVNSAAQRQSR